ncbi:MAG: hypothetical protein IJ736_01145 [Firmicutes bacterium]|nr:hypothetical protein [Bacillota bacterium]
MAFDNEYELLTINVPDGFCLEPQKIDICVGSIPMEEKQCSEVLENPFKHLTTNNLKVMRSILKDAWIYCENRVKILVLPELYCPIYWLDELIRFSKKSQIAIITGLQYIKAEDGRVFNYLCTILPFKTGFNAKYKNAFLYIREKNDYSPREISGLKKKELYCKNADKASYQVFKWNGIDIGNMLCYEFTDVVSRALYKGKCDIIAAPVFNSDTTYFSNIIDATVRDLHAFIVQANTSIYGDSRVTGPYSRDDKDIFKIKGGKNDYAIIGTINFKEYADYQLNYYEKEYIKNENSKNKPRNKNSVKKPSARFKNKRTRRKT